MSSKTGLKIALITSDYPPVCTSAAVQMRDLAIEMARQGHKPVVITSSSELSSSWESSEVDGIPVLRLSVFRARDMSYFRRALSEFLSPFMMLYSLYRSSFRNIRWDLIVCYSPPIFLGFLLWVMKLVSRCPVYLILRDIFPEWALDLGLIRKGFAYWFLKIVANFQYSVSDVIGVQSPSNLSFVSHWEGKGGKILEVLNNWQAPASNCGSIIQIADTPLAGRKIMVYAGNMGVAQGMDILIDLAESLMPRKDIGFLFVGRGSELPRLRELAVERKMTNILFLNEIDSREMPGLLSQCAVGLIALDPRHQTHNIPGKFLTYLLYGLPVLGRVNSGDLVELINNQGVGRVCEGDSVQVLQGLLSEIIDNSDGYKAMSERAKEVADQLFSPGRAVRQIVKIVKK